MQRDSEEDAWRAIVENYGQRAELEEEPPADPADSGDQPEIQELTERRAEVEDPDRFVPPTPPPLPRVPADRLLAWGGLFGSPTVLLVCLIVGIGLPSWLGYLLVSGFIGGFVYLVVTMPRGPGDPWDDGARI